MSFIIEVIQGKDRMAAALSSSAQMQMVYDFHRQLQDIWAKRGGNVDEVIADLKAWCQAAEQSGLEAMQEFAETLRSYATPAGVRAAT